MVDLPEHLELHHGTRPRSVFAPWRVGVQEAPGVKKGGEHCFRCRRPFGRVPKGIIRVAAEVGVVELRRHSVVGARSRLLIKVVSPPCHNPLAARSDASEMMVGRTSTHSKWGGDDW